MIVSDFGKNMLKDILNICLNKLVLISLKEYVNGDINLVFKLSNRSFIGV